MSSSNHLDEGISFRKKLSEKIAHFLRKKLILPPAFNILWRVFHGNLFCLQKYASRELDSREIARVNRHKRRWETVLETVLELRMRSWSPQLRSSRPFVTARTSSPRAGTSAAASRSRCPSSPRRAPARVDRGAMLADGSQR